MAHGKRRMGYASVKTFFKSNLMSVLKNAVIVAVGAVAAQWGKLQLFKAFPKMETWLGETDEDKANMNDLTEVGVGLGLGGIVALKDKKVGALVATGGVALPAYRLIYKSVAKSVGLPEMSGSRGMRSLITPSAARRQYQPSAPPLPSTLRNVIVPPHHPQQQRTPRASAGGSRRLRRRVA